jgi:uncharacterized membrane protein
VDALKWMYVALGVLLIASSIPFLVKKVKPNPFYGYRSYRTLHDEQAWYDANAFCARRLMITGVAVIIASFWFAEIEWATHQHYGEVVSIVLLAGLLATGGLSIIHHRKLCAQQQTENN